MMIGFGLMVISGLLLYYAIPVRTTQSLWFRIKVVLLILAAINAFTFSGTHAGFCGLLGLGSETTPAHSIERGDLDRPVGGRGGHRPNHCLRLV
ncbi:MAG: hypothetical protein ACJ0RB_08900 [Candidatus Azotimanducaceae bacterium]